MSSRTKVTGNPERAPSEMASSFFHQFARRTAEAAGRPLTFLIALLLIVLWLGAGPGFRFSDTWQLIINTATTIITFLMVFLIQNTQNRDSRTLHLKLDELIKSAGGASNSLLDLDQLSDAQLKQLEQQYQSLYRQGRVRPVSRD